MTLGELKDRGEMPSLDQILFLELEESKKCTEVGKNQTHRYHCHAGPLNQIGNPTVKTEPCYRILALHNALRRMFPGIELSI